MAAKSRKKHKNKKPPEGCKASGGLQIGNFWKLFIMVLSTNVKGKKQPILKGNKQQVNFVSG
jgi:hypothetical protein